MIALVLPAASVSRDVLARLLSWAVLLLLAVLLASTYFGHSPSPYGACYGSAGRTIPCDLATRASTPQRPPNER